MAKPNKAVSLKLNGKPFAIDRRPPSVRKVCSVLEKLPADEVFTTQEFAKQLGLSADCLKRTVEYATDFTRRYGNHRIWGSRAAIAAFDAQVSQ